MNAANDPKVLVITGGSRGLGRSMALAAARAGRDVVLTYRTDQAAAEAVVADIREQGQRAVALALDVAEADRFPAFADTLRSVLREEFGQSQFHYLVNNAGHGHHALLAETQVAAFDGLVAVHLKGPFFLTQALLPLLAEGGRILNVSSGLTRFALPGFAAYASVKGAIEVLSRYMAKELGAKGISVNTLAPGAIETDFGGGAVRDDPNLNGFIASQTALGRVGQPDDVGGVTAALLGEDAGWINAQRIEVSGGMFL